MTEGAECTSVGTAPRGAAAALPPASLTASRRRVRRVVFGAIAALLLALAAPPTRPASGAGVSVALQPVGATVAPGSDFDVVLQCTAAGDPFNGFDAVVSWDPAALTLLPLSPLSLQQGSLMTGACGNTFHDFEAGAGSAAISDALLCRDLFVAGPGPLYRLRFRASTEPQVTALGLSGLVFYHAGAHIGPVSATGAAIGIGMAVPLDAGPAPASFALSIAPNPGRGILRLTATLPRAGEARLRVFDLQGRCVRLLAEGPFPAGPRQLAWDGHDDAGRRVAPGVYLVTFRSETGAVTRRAVLLP